MTLEQMEIYPESSRHEAGPGQNEIDFISSAPLSAADNLVTFKNTVKSVANRNGLYASFMPKPLPDKCGSSLQIMLSCTKNGENVFAQREGCLTTIADRMLGGLLHNLPAMTLFMNGVTNSYARMEAIEPLRHVAWTKYNLNVPVRLRGGEKNGYLMLMTPDNTCNPYFAIGLVINACMDGIENAISAGEPVLHEAAAADGAGEFGIIPKDLREAVKTAGESKFIKKTLPAELVEYVAKCKNAMSDEYEAAQDREIFETARFFYTL